MPVTQSKTVEDIPKFLREAREAYSFACQVDQVDGDAAKADNLFANASDELKEQWEKVARDKRIAEGRPVLQWNRIAVSVQQVVNAGRQNKPSIRISAADGGTPETADYFQSRIRHLEYECNADTARDTARNQQVTSGRGFIRYSVEYIPGTFDQRITIEPIENQFSVVWDPGSRLYDRSDADWWMVLDWISREKHIREYGTDSVVTRTDFTREDNPAPGWIGVGKNNELIQVAQYWKKHYVPRTLALISSGDPMGMELPIWEDEVPEELKHRIVRTRQDTDVSIGCYVINGAEILKETTWIGSSVPIVPLWGRTEVVDGERRTFSLIRNAKDPQRSLNFYVSNIAEQIAMMPKTPFLAPIGSIVRQRQPDSQILPSGAGNAGSADSSTHCRSAPVHRRHQSGDGNLRLFSRFRQGRILRDQRQEPGPTGRHHQFPFLRQRSAFEKTGRGDSGRADQEAGQARQELPGEK
jgi:hypothetical protein